MKKLNYPNHPIYSIKSLASLLGVNQQDLQNVTANSNNYFQLNQQKKADGSKRDCYIVQQPLKSIHKKIKDKITSRVIYPDYIQGSVRNRSNITNAMLHEKSKIIIQLDIKNFFPSVSKEYIYSLWRYFFHFSYDVSKTLMNLITFNGNLVQGSPLSSDIANLIFWDKEHDLVHCLSQSNLIYSRYVDDISISSKEKISDKLKTNLIKQVNSMFKSKGLKLKHNKTKIFNGNNQMLVTGLVVNQNAKISQKYIDRTYKEMNNRNISQNSIVGKINYIKETRPKKARKMIKHIKEYF